MGCNCNEKKYNFSMGCCVPVLAPIENYYTKYQIDEMLEEIESGITSGCCITPEEVDEKIDAAISGITPCDLSDYYTKEEVDAKIPSLSGYATEQWVEDKHYITGVDLSDYALKSEIPTVPTSNTAFTNDAGYLTEHQHLKTINGESIVGDGNIVITGGSCDLSQYWTSAQTESAITSAMTVVENEIPSLNGYATEQWVLDKHYISGVDLSDYVTFKDMGEYVDDTYTKEETNNLFVTKQYFSSNTVSRDTFITTIYNLNEEINSLKAAISACCGSTGGTEYRWIVVPNDYTCSGTTKMTKEKQQSSTDGINWTDTGQYRTGSTVLEVNSEDCGYVPVTTYKVNMRYNNGTEDSRACDGSSNLRWLNPSNWENITGVTVGTCIDEIGNLCFYGFSGLTSVSLPSTITRIDKQSFAACISLPSITIPSGVTYIGELAFYQCTDLESIVIPNGVTAIEYATLSQCSSITSITLSDSLKTIGVDAMSHCTSLEYIEIPSGVTYIDEYAFIFDTSLESVTFLATTPPTINGSIFFGDDKLTTIYVPKTSVDAYKTAWSEYASIIQAIP